MSNQTVITPARATTVAGFVLFMDMLLHGLSVPVLPVLPAVVEKGPAAAGLLFSSYAIAMVISTFFAGRIVDKQGAKTPLIIGLITLTLASLLFSLGAPYSVLLIARLLQGAAGGLSWVAALSLITAATSFEQRGKMMGIALSTISLGSLAGPPLAGVLVDAFGARSPYFLAAVLSTLILCLLLVLIPGTPSQAKESSGPFAVLKVSGSPALVVAIAIGAAALAAIQPVLPGHLGPEVSSTRLGIVFSVAVIASVVVNLIVGPMVGKISAKLLIGIGVVLAAVSLVAIGYSASMWQVYVGMALLGASAAVLLAPTTTLIGEQGFKAQPPTLGGSYALYNFAYALGLAAGPLIAGFAVSKFGFAIAMVIIAVIIAVFGAVTTPKIPNYTLSQHPA